VELAEEEPGVLWVAKSRDWPKLREKITAAGYRATAHGAPYQERVMFSVKARRNRLDTLSGAQRADAKPRSKPTVT